MQRGKKKGSVGSFAGDPNEGIEPLKCFIGTLPDELLVQILGWLDPASLVSSRA